MSAISEQNTSYYKYNRKNIGLKNYTESTDSKMFYINIAKSNNYVIYSSMPNLLQNIARIIDQKKLKVKIFNNITLKTSSDDVVLRLLVKNKLIYIKNNLFGIDAKDNSSEIYLKIYNEYFSNNNRDTILDEKDTEQLIKIVENNI